MVAAAPALAVSATVNWDLLAVALSTVALLAWSRRARVWAGVLLGLAIATKFYPLLFFGPLLLLALRRKATIGVTVGVAALTWAAVNLPVYLAAPEGWLRFFRFSTERPVGWGTLWYIGAYLPIGDSAGLRPFTEPVVSRELNLVSLAAFLACCVGIAALAFLARRPPRLAALLFLVVAAFLVTNKVWSQQFVLWLIPLAVLARPKWGAFLIWQACEVVYSFGLYQVLLQRLGGDSTLSEGAFAVIALGRWVTLTVLCALVVVEALWPDRDVVRAGGADDPDGGSLIAEQPAEMSTIARPRSLYGSRYDG
jgi:uncharacterized membrane protein